MSFVLQTKLDKLVNKDRGDGATPSEKKSDSVDMLTSIMDQCAEIEKDNGDPNQTNFAGMMGVIMQKLLKSKKGSGGVHTYWFCCCPALCKPSSNF